MSKYAGGLYIWRVDKPHAFLGLPFIGRHFGYAGMTNSYYWRGKQQLEGSVKYDSRPYSWSDLRPKRYCILPLPAHLLNSKHKWRRRFVRMLETVLIAVTCPVYNDTQQPPWNLRKISKAKAAIQRANRDQYGRAYRAAKGALRLTVQGSALALIVYVWMVNR